VICRCSNSVTLIERHRSAARRGGYRTALGVPLRRASPAARTIGLQLQVQGEDCS
jgi:hypothetical protein